MTLKGSIIPKLNCLLTKMLFQGSILFIKWQALNLRRKTWPKRETEFINQYAINSKTEILWKKSHFEKSLSQSIYYSVHHGFPHGLTVLAADLKLRDKMVKLMFRAGNSIKIWQKATMIILDTKSCHCPRLLGPHRKHWQFLTVTKYCILNFSFTFIPSGLFF